jgi:hypothetical protein
LGLLIAPLAVPCVFGLSAVIKNHSWSEGIFPFGMILFFGFPIFYLAASCLGFPLWLLLRRYKIESLPVFAAGGGLIGWLACGLLFRLWFAPEVVTFALAGLVSAMVFWIFVNFGCSSSLGRA